MDLVQIVGASWLSKSVSVAARLGIADALEAGPLTVDQIASRIGCHGESLLRLMRVLAAFQIFQIGGDGRVANSALSERLRSDHPMSLRHFCILAGEEYYEACGALLHTIKTGESGFAHIFGGSIYEYMEKNAETARVYDQAMEDLSRPVGAFLAREFDFRQMHKVVDVGGGNGILIRELMRLHPDIHGIVLDREDVCRRSEALFGEELAGRLTFQPGDFFRDVPIGADAYLLKNVLHNWNAENCARILGPIRDAMLQTKANGARKPRLFVIEPLVEHDETSPRKVVHALFQIVICQEGTRERTADELRSMVAGAKFELLGAKMLPSGHTVLEAVAS